ncbi:DegT/DnrJ/EryC1/StrS family aminotransferase [Exiguobacterium artemiae]|uniref:DegT/DnrJ/EryC1/StrS family aminotransferase n=1 Tax=Exiguobacterium artemiae TaxID=340145 RepID=UPI002964A612|nr:DegT/DnrJ/EryC1/StrS family aminotransferase [Exiguobacterium sibiricum]MDW2886772.1 DegT/DnrJ/EryC1/StrS family aminotransferase [Exiguobacterium sibiricum]
MTDKKRILLSSPHMSGNEMKYIKEAFDTNWIAPLGANVDGFEKELAEYVGIKSAAAVSSGTAAIHLALRLLDTQQDDLIFCSTFTFVATANPILYEKAIPIFIDSEPDSWNMSPEALKKAFEYALSIKKMPKAVIVVHLYGQSAKMEEILEICNEYGVPIIEDSAESLGASYHNKKSGTHGKFGVYSFNGNKIITTSGGGMLVSDDEDMIKKARFLATQSRNPAVHYEHSEIGFNYRMSNISAGIGRGQLEVIDDRVEARRNVFKKYKQQLEEIDGISFMPELNNSYSNRWLTTLIIDENKTDVSQQEFIEFLNEMNIETRPLWKPMHLQPLFKGTKFFEHSLNNDFSKKLFETGVCLPSGSDLTDTDQIKVINAIKSIFNKVVIK